MYRTQEQSQTQSPVDEHVDNDENYEFSGATLKISSDINGGPKDPLQMKTNNSHSDSAVLSGTDVLSPPVSSTSSPPSYQQEDKLEETISPPSAELPQPIQFSKPKVGTPANFFSFRSGNFGHAVNDIVNVLLKPNNDTNIVGSWLLTEINHWDHERERVYILTTKTLWEIKYDFIALRLLQHAKIQLSKIDTIIKGKLKYPESSLVPERSETGIRLQWNKGQQLSFLTSWNPFANDIPWKTITDHPLYSYQDPYNSPTYIKENLEKNRKIYSVELLHQALLRVCTERTVENSFVNQNCKFEEGPILLQNYVGIGAMIHNKHNFGFFKVRGKFSF